MGTCQQCGGEATNKLSPALCMTCLEKAMDNLTAEDIGDALKDLADRGSPRCNEERRVLNLMRPAECAEGKACRFPDCTPRI